MSFDWTEYVRLAERVHDAVNPDDPGGSREAAYRACVSRAYYGAFNVCLNEVKRAGWNPSRDGTKHGFVIDRFKGFRSREDVEMQKAWNKIGEDLDRLRVYRNNADYDSELSENPDSRSVASLRYANRILKKLHGT